MFNKAKTLAVYVTDKEKAKRFYIEILGFDLSADLDQDLCFLRSKSGEFHIYLKGGCSPSSVDNKACRLSFFLETERSVLETFNALKDAGVELLSEAPEQVGDDIYCFQFKDPDGNILEVSGKS